MNPNNDSRQWTAEELALLATPGLSNAQISAQTGRSQPAIRGKRQRLAKSAAVEAEKMKDPLYRAQREITRPLMENISKALASGSPWDKVLGMLNQPMPSADPGQTVRAIRDKIVDNFVLPPGTVIVGSGEVPAAAYEEDKARVGAEFWKGQHDQLRRKYEKALKEQSAVDRLIELAREMAPKSYSPLPQIHRVSPGKGSAQSAVLFLSDSHVGQTIEASQTLGFGGYDFEIFLARLKFYEEAVTSILRDHTTTRLDELVIAFGGDLLHGALNHGAEASQQHTLFAQWYGAAHAFAQFIRNLAPLVPKVRVYSTCGNHTRFSHQHRMPTDNRNSNFDSFVTEHTKALTKDLTTVSWTLDEQPVSMFDVQGFKIQLLHGDTLRGADKALGIPNHAIGRLISSNSQLFGKHGLESPSIYLCGHWHRSIQLPHAKGTVIINGGFPGIDGYGLANGFSPVDASQTFFLMHPKFGKTATYEIALKFAEVGATRPYEIPGDFI